MNKPKIVALRAAGSAPPEQGVVIAGRLVEVGQSHLLGPFVDLLGAIDLVASAATGPNAPGAEERALEAAYRSLFQFFRALLPSAGSEALEGLTYSTSLLLVGEAVEASRVVEPLPELRRLAASRSTSVRSRRTSDGRSGQ
jgi:hypothetical protein